MEGIQAGERALDSLSTDIIEQIDRFDPLRQAKVIRDIFCSQHQFADRPVFGARHASWMALEDKMIIDSLWDKIGIPRAPSLLCSLSSPDLYQQAQTIDLGMGTVWVGDNRDGWHGGAERLRWIRTASQAQESQIFLRRHSVRIRIMPFLDGIPCSIHGWVFPDHSIALRPCEMLIFRQKGATKLCYAGAATSWKPSEHITADMRQAAVQTGDFLRSTIGYKGSFTIDGVVTKSGFLPTELNPRFGGALARMASSIPDLPLYLLHLCTVEDYAIDYQPNRLEKLLVSEAERTPIVRAGLPLSVKVPSTKIHLRPSANSGWTIVPDDTPLSTVASIGPANSGSHLRLSVDPSLVRHGASAAPILCDLLTFVNRQWNLNLPVLEPAPNH